MKTPDRLRQEIEAIERRAFALSDRMTALLMGPVDDRVGLGALLAEFEALRAMAEQELTRLRRKIPRSMLPAASAGVTEGAFARAARTRLKVWTRVARAVGEIDAGMVWPLMPDTFPRLDPYAIQSNLLGRVLTDAHRAVNPAVQSGSAAELGCFPDIALDSNLFVTNLHLAARMLLARRHPRPWSFLDVGCGGGMKLALAAPWFDRATGLEYDPVYVETARRNLDAMRASRCAVVEADGLAFDGYGDHDVVYFYQPMKIEDGLLALERRIVAQAGEGAILIAPYHGFRHRAEDLGCLHVDGYVFVKGTDRGAVADLMAETRRMGPHMVLHDERVPAGTDWLEPLWRACVANGIRPEV